MKVLIYFVLVLKICEIYGNQISYDNYKVYRLTPKSKEAVEILKHIEQTQSEYDFWTGVKEVGYPVDIMVPPHFTEEFNTTLISSNEFDAEVFVPNVQKLIDNEKPIDGKSTFDFEWTQYKRLEEINKFLKDLVAQYPDKVFLVLAGKSYEGRDILGVKVTFQNGNKNRTVFLEANIHAREWITSAVTTWILNQLLTSEVPAVRQVAESHDWYIIPVFNPDGFEYSHTTDRMWRKTRTPYSKCVGVDPNRNWGYHYNDGGSSSSACSETYRGPTAFSEASTRTLSEFITSVNVPTPLQAYISVHSYGQLLLTPYGHTPNHLDNYNDLYDVGVKATEKLAQRYGTQYRVGNIVEALYVASGGSMDWVKGTFGTPITYSYELRDTGTYGFILPPGQIIPTAEETLDSLVTIFQEFDKIL